MSLKKQEELLNKLGNLGQNIPGLNVNSIVKKIMESDEQIKIYKNAIESERKDNIDRGMSSEDASKEAEDKFKEIEKNYEESTRGIVNDKVNQIKEEYRVFKKAVESIPKDVLALVQNIALPSTITAPPGAPNPLYVINQVRQGKNLLNRTLDNVIVSFSKILKLSNEIKFELPESILKLFDKIATIDKLIKNIP